MLETQAPRLLVRNDDQDESWVTEAASLAAGYGLTLDGWQHLVLGEWLQMHQGLWSHLTCGLSVPRQNGKNSVLEARELFGLIGLGEAILHTAHQVKTAQKHFRRLKHYFGTKANDPAAKYPELNALVESVRNVNGQEAIFLKNGGSVEIVARSAGSGRGFTVDTIVCDEAQDMSDEDLEALLSTTSSAPLGNPQWIFTGTPPGPKSNGEVFTRTRADALGTEPYMLSWVEWSMDPDGDLDSRAQWKQANPALGIRLLESVVRGERSRLSDEGFMRERGGMWAADKTNRGVIPALSWEQQTAEESAMVTRFALGVEVGPDLAWASVSVAAQRPDGTWEIALEDNQHTKGAGVSWLLPMLEHLVKSNPQIRAVVVDVSSPISALIQKRGPRYYLQRPDGTRVMQVHALRVQELGVGCSSLVSGVSTGSVWHIGQPQLTSAALQAGKRALGDSGMWVWSRKTAQSDITPIQSATYALVGAQTEGPTPARMVTGDGPSRRATRRPSSRRKVTR